MAEQCDGNVAVPAFNPEVRVQNFILFMALKRHDQFMWNIYIKKLRYSYQLRKFNIFNVFVFWSNQSVRYYNFYRVKMPYFIENGNESLLILFCSLLRSRITQCFVHS